MKNSTRLSRKIKALEEQENIILDSMKGVAWDLVWSNPTYTRLRKRISRTKEACKYAQLREVNKFCNRHGYSDVEAYEVVNVISDTTVEVRAMSIKQIAFPKDFHPGGFCGHYSDNRQGQDYEYTSNPDAKVERVRWSEANKQWQQGKHGRFMMSATPHKFYDYNF